MINYIGQFKREKINTVIRAAIRRNKNIYTFLLFLPAIIYLLFHNEIINAPEKISGDKAATALLINGDGKCTAFLVSDKGLLLTARHCLEGIDDEVLISFTKIDDTRFQELKAKVIYFPDDENDDYAVLKLVRKLPDSPKIKPLEVSGEIKNPEDYNPNVTIIGYPGGEDQAYDKGNIVRVYERSKDPTTFETNEIYQGMSGGPVIDQETGLVIGIVSFKIDDKQALNEEESNKYNWAITEGLDQEGISYHEKIQQVFKDKDASHIDW